MTSVIKEHGRDVTCAQDKDNPVAFKQTFRKHIIVERYLLNMLLVCAFMSTIKSLL